MDKNDYDVNEHGIITSPGKFEAEPLYVPYFWDIAMVSGEEETVYDDETPISFFIVSDDDRKEFPELDNIYGLALWETDTGFVNCTIFETEKEYTDTLDKIDGTPN